MTANHTQNGLNPLGRVLKALGRATDPSTRTGKVFKVWENGTTRAATWLASNDFYLDRAGKTMERSFMMRLAWIKGLELVLKSWRFPTASGLEQVQADLGRVNSQVEALAYQMEYLIEQLERREVLRKELGALNGTRASDDGVGTRRTRGDGDNGDNLEEEGGAGGQSNVEA